MYNKDHNIINLKKKFFKKNYINIFLSTQINKNAFFFISNNLEKKLNIIQLEFLIKTKFLNKEIYIIESTIFLEKKILNLNIKKFWVIYSIQLTAELNYSIIFLEKKSLITNLLAFYKEFYKNKFQIIELKNFDFEKSTYNFNFFKNLNLKKKKIKDLLIFFLQKKKLKYCYIYI